ncbi:MAG TPA: glycine--tRNA ligase subunit beta [Dissulfurispiraceae bacterium]|nr:glycine--tRNA ligase subunit beta [Dissulfurispiraceae bacterium]
MAENQKETTVEPSHLLIFEIGTEEIPARFLPDALVALKAQGQRTFSEYRLSAHWIKTYASPRRLVLLADISPSQKEEEKEVWGPPVSASYDSDGRPTKAAEAFAKNCGVPVKALESREKGKGLYVVATVRAEARPTAEILPQILPKIILSLTFPKSMRWADGTMRFVRPIQWIFAMYQNEKVRFELEGIRSGSMTKGHRFLSPAVFELKDGKTYINLLRNNFVILDPEERRKIIVEASQRLASTVGASLIEDEALLEHVLYLVEYPVPVLGTFPADYLALPKELLVTVMKDHQKYFALQDSAGNLDNHFVVVSNTKIDNAETIRKGAERVIKARFEDARFYFQEDRKTPLEQRLEALKKVIYHDKLGSLYDKTLRITSVADFIGDRCRPAKKDDIRTAALLCKADLVAGVVREFPELQGIMGKYYALNDGYEQEVATAIAEHYLPTHSGGTLPLTDTGAIVSLADKADNIASFFAIGETPTGTEDPFALRRQALGMVAILMDKGFPLSVSQILEKALQPYAAQDRETLLRDLIRFFEQRMEPLFTSAGYPQDAVAAVLQFAGASPFVTVRDRLEALRWFRERPECEALLTALKRVKNIAPKGQVPPSQERLFEQDEERNLYREVQSVRPHLRALIEKNDYHAALVALQRLTDPINTFFDKVLVMDKREEIKQNRLSLLAEVSLLTRDIADLSKLS